MTVHAEPLDDDALAEPVARRPSWLRTLVRDKKALLGLIVLVVLSLAALLAPWITPYDPNEMMFDMIGAPSWAHPLGTDDLGRDLLSRLIFVHALPNALIPVVTVMGIALALLMAGTVVVENVFAIKGLGRVLIQGILNRDYPVVQGAILVVSAIFVFANLLVDVLYTVIDPRIRYE